MLNHAIITNPTIRPTQILGNLSSGQLLMVDAQPGNAVIICHPHYAQIVGPGCAIGGLFDMDAHEIIPIGEISFKAPESLQDKKEAYLKRDQWMCALQKIVRNYGSSLERAWMILLLLEKFFGLNAVEKISDEVIAQLVGVLPKTVTLARQKIKETQTQSITKKLQGIFNAHSSKKTISRSFEEQIQEITVGLH